MILNRGLLGPRYFSASYRYLSLRYLSAKHGSSDVQVPIDEASRVRQSLPGAIGPHQVMRTSVQARLLHMKDIKHKCYARNHNYSTEVPGQVNGLLGPSMSRTSQVIDSFKIRILRFLGQEEVPKDPERAKNYSDILKLASDQYEQDLVREVVLSGDISVKFEDIGALEYVKEVLHELVILPMARPEFFTVGMTGVLLYGPPGTGKTLLVKALASEAKANFIAVTGATLLSKFKGDSEKYVQALFSLARKLAPVVVFIDEIDALLSTRGRNEESESSRGIHNQLMVAWDGLLSNDDQRVLVLGATNRPFDIDEAALRRMPRRILVDLPDAENRVKILKVLLAEDNLESGFSFEKLAEATEGYSGSDLKSLCIAAALARVKEVVKGQIMVNNRNKYDGGSSLRPLKLDDFILSKPKARATASATNLSKLRSWSEQYGDEG